MEESSTSPLAAPTQRVSWFKIAFLAASQLSVQIAYSVLYAVGNPLMARLDLPHWSYAILTSADPVVGIFLQPLVGYLSDIKVTRFGRRRPWIVAGVVVMCISLLIMVLIDYMKLTITPKRAIFITCFILFNIGLNVMQSPARTLLDDLIPEEQLLAANSYASILIGAGILLANAPGAIARLAQSPFDEIHVVLIAGAFLLLCSTVATCVAGAERTDIVPAIPEENPLVETWRAIKRMERPVWLMGLVVFFGCGAYVPWQVAGNDFFGLNVFKGDPTNPDDVLYSQGVGFAMLVTSVSCLVAIVWCVVQNWMINRYGLKPILVISFILSAVGLFPAITVRNRWILLAFLSLTTINFLLFQAANYAFLGMVVAREELGTYIGCIDLFIETGGWSAVLAWQLGIGEIWPGNRGPTIFCGGLCAIAGLIVTCFLPVPPGLLPKKLRDLSNEPLNV